MSDRSRDDIDPQVPPATGDGRAPYEPPELRVYGSLEDLTRFDFLGGPADQPFGDFSS